MTTRDDAFSAALDQLEERYLRNPHSDVHRVYRGLKSVKGRRTEVECLVCVVEQKQPSDRLTAQHKPAVPRHVYLGSGEGAVPTDVIEQPAARDQRHFLESPEPTVSTRSLTTHRECHNCPVPGGVEIRPVAERWVGTLGGAIALDAGDGTVIYAGLTNAHVTGFAAEGRKILQPFQSRDHIGTVLSVARIGFRPNDRNLIDAAVIDCRRTDGPYAPETHTVRPWQLDVGEINPEPADSPRIGDLVIKSGRTTGVTGGTCVGVDGRVAVGYGDGLTAVFVDQLIIEGRGRSEQFSAAGDSGSLILRAGTHQPWGLLFAGGGNQTIANPLEPVLAWCNGRWFSDV